MNVREAMAALAAMPPDLPLWSVQQDDCGGGWNVREIDTFEAVTGDGNGEPDGPYVRVHGPDLRD